MVDLYEVFMDINRRGFNIDKAEVARLHHELKSMKNRSAYMLMDKGYISTVDITDVKELVLSLTQEFGNEIENLFSASDGDLYISPETTFITIKRTKNEELKEVMQVLHDYCYADELLEELLALLKDTNRDGFLKPKLNITSSYMRYGVSNFINRREFLRIIGDTQKLYLINVKALMYFEFLVSIGIPENIVAEYKESNRGILMNELTFQEEIEIANYISEFHVMPNTEFSSLYIDARVKYYNPKTKKYEKDTYFKTLSDDIVAILDSVQGDELIPRLITKYQMIVELKSETISKQLFSVIGEPITVTKDYSRIWENGGLYTLEWYTCTEFSKCNALKGYTGEFITEENLLKMNMKLGEYPLDMVRIKRSGNKVEVDTERVYRVDDLGLEQHVGKDIVFEYTDLNKILKRYDVESLEGVYTKVFQEIKEDNLITVDKSILDYYKKVVADLVVTLISLDCGCSYSSRIPLDNRLNNLYKDDNYIFYCACSDAEKYVEENSLFA